MDPFPENYSHKHDFACNVYNALYLLTFDNLIHMWNKPKNWLNQVLLNKQTKKKKTNINGDFYLILTEPLKPIHGPTGGPSTPG